MDRSNQRIFVGQEGEVFHQVIKIPVTLHGNSLFLSVVIFSNKEYYRGKTKLPAYSDGTNAAGTGGKTTELLGKIPGSIPGTQGAGYGSAVVSECDDPSTEWLCGDDRTRNPTDRTPDCASARNGTSSAPDHRRYTNGDERSTHRAEQCRHHR
jgi:hypothetical protein